MEFEVGLLDLEMEAVAEEDRRSKSNEKMEMPENAIVLISWLLPLVFFKKMRLRVSLIDED